MRDEHEKDQSPEKGGYIPWRGVTSVETPEQGDPILHLDCGHTVTWLSGQGLPVAARCMTCDPPTFHGKPFPPTVAGMEALGSVVVGSVSVPPSAERGLERARALSAKDHPLSPDQRIEAGTERQETWRPILDEMSRLMQAQPDGRYLDATETWNQLLDFVRSAGSRAESSVEAGERPILKSVYLNGTMERKNLAAHFWQLIETAPEDGAWFLAWGYDCGFCVYRMGPGFITGEDPQPTHWMHLPVKP